MKFKVTYEVVVEVDIDEAVISEVTSPDWQKEFYDLNTASDVADHIVFNVVANDIRDVTMLDGFAHFKMELVRYSNFDYNLVETKILSKEEHAPSNNRKRSKRK